MGSWSKHDNDSLEVRLGDGRIVLIERARIEGGCWIEGQVIRRRRVILQAEHDKKTVAGYILSDAGKWVSPATQQMRAKNIAPVLSARQIALREHKAEKALLAELDAEDLLAA